MNRIAQFTWEDEQIDDDLEHGVRSITKRYFVFAGANFGTPATVRNPNNFDRSDIVALTAQLPAPVQLDIDRLPHDGESTRLEYLTFGAFAYQDARAPLMSEGFDGPKDNPHKPHTYITAIAQAEVFNNHSWDLWTQMWHSQLISSNSDWLIDQIYLNNSSFDPSPALLFVRSVIADDHRATRLNNN